MIAKLLTALGLALLLVVGAWSNAHRQADAHSTLCLAPGASAPASPGAEVGAETGIVETIAVGAAVCAFAALCGIVLLRLHRGFAPATGILLRRRFRDALPVRAGPAIRVAALTPLQLSVSRT